MSSRKIKINTSCVANSYAGPDEKIIEFSSPGGGGLIAFLLRENGGLLLSVYNTDETVEITTPKDTVSLDKKQRDIAALALHRMSFSAPDSEVSAEMRESALSALKVLDPEHTR